MTRLLVSFLITVSALGVLLMAGCTQAPPPAPTAAPAKPAAAPTAAPAAPTAAPTKAAEPTKPAAQPSAAPAAKANFPEKGKSINLIVGYAAGGSFDSMARLLAPELEKVLGVPIVVVNKPGASEMVASTELARAKPDGYTIAFQGQPIIAVTYTDPEAKAVYSRKDFTPIAVIEAHSVSMFNKPESPIKNVKDLVDAAKANPEKISVATSGLLGTGAIPIYLLQDLTGVKFALVNTDSGAASVTTTLGGHSNAGTGTPSLVVEHTRAGNLRILATTGTERNRYLPDAPTFREQGYEVVGITYVGIGAPAGVPKEVVGVLQNAFKSVIANEAVAKKMVDTYNEPYYQDDAGYNKIWDQMDQIAQKMVKIVRNK